MRVHNNVPQLSLNRANFIEHEGSFWELLPFFENRPNYLVGGGNGQIYRAIDPEDGEECIIKISKFSKEKAIDSRNVKKRILRFYREIETLYIANEKSLDGIVSIYGDGECLVDRQTFPFFIMERCDCNLKEYLLENEVDLSQKILLCYEIAKSISNLHDEGIYHRDIKAENIFFIQEKPILGDLGLAENRNSDFDIFEKGDIIGPIGWLSPEATNKFLTEKTPLGNRFNCNITRESDIFQLGKLFWYILQGNLPLGQLIFDDFKSRDKFLFDIIFAMLQHDATRRPNIDDIEEGIKSVFPNYYL